MIRHTKAKILYVDDTMEQRYAMRRILETEGYIVLEAGSGREALQLLDRSLALAVVDVRLPDMNGYDLTHQIKQREPFLPILQVSASFSDPNLRASGLSGGADAYIAQPVHPLEFISLIKRMMQTWEIEESLRFLAGIGSQLNATLSVVEASQNICNAMLPHFADRCILFLANLPGQKDTFWSRDIRAEDPYCVAMQRLAELKTVELVDSRTIIASLVAGNQSLGSIAFFLNKDREYTLNDLVLAGDLRSRAALTIQNCLLFSSEQATRVALIQSEKLATAGRMSAAIAHEINNPLEALTNLIYILEKSPEATDSIRKTAAVALAEVMRIAHITRQTLGFYRELRTPVTLDLSQSIRETLGLYAKQLEVKQISVQLQLEESVWIEGIKGEIRQVISNLLVNALEAINIGGRITIMAHDCDGKAQVVIGDNGPGIASSIMSRIFEPFYTTKQGTGTGLGLWITHSIIEKHQGTIDVETDTSPEHHGTRFILNFPLIRPSSSE